MSSIARHGLALGFAISAMAGCNQSPPLAPDVTQTANEGLVQRGASKTLSPALCALDRDDFTLKSTNEFFPLGVGSTWTLRGTEDGKKVELRVTVLRKTQVVGGVRTRVVEEREFENGELIESSRNFFAATEEGTVCYFGEDVDMYEDGEIVSHEGAWRADAPRSRPGIIMPADPRVGMTFQMEAAPGIAEDAGEIVAKGVRVRVRAGTFKNTIRIRESNPLDGSTGFKNFARGVGIVVDGPLSLVRYRVARGGDRDDNDDEDDG
jgi:hypothetical protein